MAQWSIALVKLLSRRAVNVHKLCSANACETLPITLQVPPSPTPYPRPLNQCDTYILTYVCPVVQHHQQDVAVAQAGCDIVCRFIHPLPLLSVQPTHTPAAATSPLLCSDPLDTLLARPLHTTKATGSTTSSSSFSYAARLGIAGACEAVVGVLRIHGRHRLDRHHSHSDTVVASAARAVSALACLSVENSAWLASIGAFEELLSCWQVHASDPFVSAVLIGAIADLLLLPGNRTRLAHYCISGEGRGRSDSNDPSSPSSSSSWVRALLLEALRQHSPPPDTVNDNVKDQGNQTAITGVQPSSSLSLSLARRGVVVAAATVLSKMHQHQQQRHWHWDEDDTEGDTSSSSVLTGAVKAFRGDARALCRLCGAVVSEMRMAPAGPRPRRGRGKDGMLEALLAALDIHLRAAVTATAASTDTEGHHPLMLSVLAVSGCLDALGVMVQQAVDGDDDDVRDRVRLTVLLRQQQQSSPTVDHVSLWLPEALRLAVVLLTGNATTSTMMTSSYAASHSDNEISPPVSAPNPPPSSPSSLSSSSPSSSSATAPSSLSSSFLSSFASMVSSSSGATTKTTTIAGGVLPPNNNDSISNTGQNTSVSQSKSSGGSVWTWGKAMVAKGMGGLRSSTSHSSSVIGEGKSKDGATGVASAAASTSSLRQLVALALARSLCRVCALLLMLAADTTTAASEDACTATATTTTTTTTTTTLSSSMSTLSLSGMLGEQGVVELLLACLGVASQHPTTEGGVDWEGRCLLDVTHWAVCALSLMVDSPSCGALPVNASTIDSNNDSSSSEFNVRRVCFSQRSGTVLIAALQVVQRHQQQQLGSASGCGVHNVLSVMLAMARQKDHSKMGLLRLLGGGFTTGNGIGGGGGVSGLLALTGLLVRALHHESLYAIAAEGHAQALGLAPAAAVGDGDDVGGGERERAREALLLARVSLLLPVTLVAVFVEHGGLSVCGALGRCGNAVRLVGSVATVYVLPQATRAITALVAHIMTTSTTQIQQPQPSQSPPIDIGTCSSSFNQDNDSDNGNDDDDGDEAALDLSGDTLGLGQGLGQHGTEMHQPHRFRRVVVGGDAIRRVVASTTSATAQEPPLPLPLPLDGFDCLLTLVSQLCLALRCLCLDADNKDRLATATVASSSSSTSFSSSTASGVGYGSSDNVAVVGAVAGVSSVNSSSNNNDSSPQAPLQQTPTKQPVPATASTSVVFNGLLEALLQSLTAFRLTAESSALFLSETPSDNNSDNDNIDDNISRLCVVLRRLTDEAAATITVLREAQLSAQLRGGIKSTSGLTSSAGRAFSIIGGSSSTL